MPASSSDSSDDENMEQLRAAVDTGLLKDSMYNEKIISSEPVKPIQKSERFLDDDNKSENSILVSKAMQDHIWSKLSQIIRNQIVFVDVKCKRKKSKTKSGIKLLSHKDDFLQIENEFKTTEESNRRIINTEQTKQDLAKVQECAVTQEWLLLQKTIKDAPKIKNHSKKPKIEFYKSKNSILHLVEQENEFSTLRKKNNWDESKISRKIKINKFTKCNVQK